MLSRFNIPKYVVILLVFTLINMIILGIRNYIVGTSIFDFLKSNLFSGILPLIIAVLIQMFYKNLNNTWFILASLVWIVFYPNSPYMISDLIHSHEETLDKIYPNLIIYDTLIIFSIAMLSVFYGFVSLKLMFLLHEDRFGSKKAHTFIIISILLSCLGFYVGRQLKSDTNFGNGYLYSWQLFTEPLYVIKTVWKHLWPIKANANTYYMMILFGFIQYQLIIMMKDIKDIETGEVVTKDELDHFTKN